MKKIIIILFFLFAYNSYCQKSNIKTVFLNNPSIIVIQLDSLEIDQVKKSMGESTFYTATDDLMWYNSKLIEKMDSLKIPIKYFKNDSIIIDTPNQQKLIKKDSTFSLYNYYFYNGEIIEKKDLFELLSE